MMMLAFIVLILCSISSFSAKNIYPSHLPRCFRNDPNLNECLVKAGQTVRPLLKDGIKEFGLPSMNPLVVPSITLEQGTKSLNYKMVLTNYTINGLDNYTINAFNVDIPKKKMHFKILFGPLVSRGVCNYAGNVFITSIDGKGTLVIENPPSTFSIDIDLELVKRDEEKYIKINNAKVIDNIYKGKARFENFEGTNEKIVKIFNKIIDEHSEELTEEVKPVILKFIEDFIKQTMNQVFGRYPYNEILPLSV